MDRSTEEVSVARDGPRRGSCRASGLRRCTTIVLTVPVHASRLTGMVVRLKPETESRLQELAATTGSRPDELLEDAMAGYLAELEQVREMLDSRYDDIKSGRVAPIGSEQALNQLRHKSNDRRRS